ncbi:nodulation protein NfeD [Salinisphaera sp. T31B1]|uniref:NfeD family protein n=1 Tax=Salinisphaera sp. T31B1 TaxID=727963 RepID=UPI00333EF899
MNVCPTIRARLGRFWLAIALLIVGTGLARTPTTVPQIEITGPIGPATSDYVVRALDQAASDNAPLVILRLDTPGGLDGAMRDIVQAVLASPVPVAGFVGPAGARAASAGTYILYATHFAAMAPTTNLGAATPVSLAGDRPAGKTSSESADDAPDNATSMRRKVINDSVAYIRGLAEQRGRNVDWAERAVREGVSLGARQALEAGVIDAIVADPAALLQRLNGQRIETVSGVHTLDLGAARITPRLPDWRTRLLQVITHPTVAYLLFMVGIYGLILEGLNPGATVPGVIGGISLLTALFAFQLLPVNMAGLGLLILGIALMIAELFAPSFGILGLGGVAAFVFGSVMLMDSSIPGFDIPLGLIGGIAVAAALLLVGILYMFLRSRRQRVWTGREGLVGQRCVALEDFDGEGRVLLQGESWLADCDRPVRREDKLIVVAVDGLQVTVRPADRQPGTAYRH